MAFVLETGANLRDGRNHGVDDSTTGVFRLPGDLVLGTFPAIGFTGANFSVYSLSGESIIAAQELDPSRFVAGSRIVEDQYIFGALRDGEVLTVFFSEQGFNQVAFDYESASYMRKYSLTTGQALGDSVEIDVPAMLSPDNSASMQTSTGLLAVSAGYSGLGPVLVVPRDLGLILIDANGTVVRGPDQLPPDTYSGVNAGGQAVVETSEGFMTFHASLQLVGSGFVFSNVLTASFQRHDANGALIGGPVPLFDIPNAGTPRTQDALKAALLADGRIVVVVADRNPPALPAGELAVPLRATILNPDGSVSVPDFGIRRAPDQTSGSVLQHFSLNALDDGGFVIGYNINGSISNQTMGFQVYGANGQPEEFHTYAHTIAAVIAGLPNQQNYTTLRGDGTGLILDATLTGRGAAVPVSDAPPDGPVIDIGTAGPDLMEGGAFNDRLDGAGGDDTLQGNGGNDTLLGGGGNDLIEGGGGDDSLAGDSGSDTMYGGQGNDSLDGGSGADSLFGDAGNDTLDGGSGFDTIFGGDGNDLIFGGSSADSLSGGNQNDSIYGGTSDDTILGGAGNDLIFGDDGNDSLMGDTGADTIWGGTGNDTLDGGTASDTLYGEAGADSLLGGSSADLLYGGTENDTIRGGTSNDTAYGGAGSDLIYGDDGDDSLFGDGGSDVIYGGRGNDTIDGGTALDTLFGDAGADSILGGSSADLIFGGTENDTIYGGTSNDEAYGGSGNDWLYGDQGDDMLFGDGGFDRLYGGDGNDTLDGGTASDTLYGGAGNDLIYAGASADLVSAGLGNDTVYGGTSNDTIFGGGGDDVIHGEQGSDVLTGGVGQDVFVFDTAIGTDIDRITDFNVADDTIHLSSSIFTGLAPGALGAGVFVANTSGLATSPVRRIVYETDTGALFYDSDGSGPNARVQFATLETGLALTAADFWVI